MIIVFNRLIVAEVDIRELTGAPGGDAVDCRGLDIQHDTYQLDGIIFSTGTRDPINKEVRCIERIVLIRKCKAVRAVIGDADARDGNEGTLGLEIG